MEIGLSSVAEKPNEYALIVFHKGKYVPFSIPSYQLISNSLERTVVTLEDLLQMLDSAKRCLEADAPEVKS